jgi:Domain of unknown function (DUF4476)
MNRFTLGFLLILTFSSAFSQKLFFIYLQSEPGQAFFVKMNEKVHSSTASGYLILSRLRDSSYTFNVGFPENKWPEQKFVVDVKAKDHGYLLKNFDEKGWGIFDMQTMAIQMSLHTNNGSLIKTEPKEVSPFTEILSKAANDPSLKERPVPVKTEEKSVAIQPVVIKEEEKPVAEPPVSKQDQPKVVITDESAMVKQEPPVEKQNQSSIVKKEEPQIKTNTETITKEPETKSILESEYRKSVVSKKSESSTSEGFGLVFIDDYGNGKKDTIRIIIPNPPKALAEIIEPSKDDKKFLDLFSNDTINQNEAETKAVKTATPVQKQVAKTNCSLVANDNDFMKLRKKMAAESSDDGMVDEAKKIFKVKCFTTAQLKNLSTLFLNDAGKYKFLDMAYTHVSDQENFSSLSTELKDEYYINRFKAMLH